MSLGQDGIQNWANHSVELDFKGLRFGPKQNKRPSDIDMFYLHGNTLILGEGKNEIGTLKDGQKWLYEKLINGWCESGKKGYFIFFTHNKFQQNGDTNVDVATCPVKEYYYHDGKIGRWLQPQQITTVSQAMHKIVGE